MLVRERRMCVSHKDVMNTASSVKIRDTLYDVSFKFLAQHKTLRNFGRMFIQVRGPYLPRTRITYPKEHVTQARKYGFVQYSVHTALLFIYHCIPRPDFELSITKDRGYLLPIPALSFVSDYNAYLEQRLC